MCILMHYLTMYYLSNYTLDIVYVIHYIIDTYPQSFLVNILQSEI